MQNALRFTLAAVLALPLTALANAQSFSVSKAKACENFARMSKTNFDYKSDAYAQAYDTEIQWRKLAVLMAPQGTDLDAEMSAARSAFWDVARNGSAADKQTFQQSLQSCVSPPKFVDMTIPAGNCARLAAFVKQNADSTRQSWETRVIQLSNTGASDEKIDQAKLKLKRHNENVKAALKIDQAWRRSNAMSRVKSNSLGMFDNEDRAGLLTTCLKTVGAE